jgi:N-acetylmuramoyl-L-alanine amidase
MRVLEAVVVLGLAGRAIAAPSVLDRVEVVGSPAPAVRLHLSGPATASAASLGPAGDAAHRLYVDLPRTEIGPALARVVPGAGPLLRVRAGQFDKTTARVVLDLASAVPFTIRQSGGTVTIELSVPAASSRPGDDHRTAAAPAIASRPTEFPHAVPPAAPVAKEGTPTATATPAPAVPAAPGANARPPAASPTPNRAPTPPPAAVPTPAAAVPTPVAPPAPATPSTPAAAPGPVAATPPAPAEHPAPPAERPAEREPAAAPLPPPSPRLPGFLPGLPSTSALPGALIALQNGRDLDRNVPVTPPAASEHAVAAPAPTPAAPATTPPPRAPAPQEAPGPFVGPPLPPAGSVEPTQTARAVPTPPVASETSAAPRTESRRVPATRQPRAVVVLDAGHGGRDPGAEGVGGVLEKDVVLDITRLVARRLAARLPVDVIMTRSDDSFIPIERRLALPGEGANLFISLHANACTDPSARGLEVFYGGGVVRNASTHSGGGPAALLGRYLNQALQARIGGVRGRARPGDFGVLIRNPVPSALIEIGYLTHPGEAVRAQDAAFHELVADAVVDAVGSFLRASAPPL